MNDMVKKYLRFMWHYSQAYTLLTIPLSGFSVAMSFFTFLAVAFGFKLPWWGYIIFFLVVLFSLATLGLLMVKTGLVAFYQQLNNKQNPELMEIYRKANGQKGDL